MQMINAKAGGVDETEKSRPPRVRKCNICEQNFHPRSRFECFCQDCRENSELLRFADWLPEADDLPKAA